jgi:hypothetical protein
MATEQQLLLRSIDDYLGPGETRFFSRGYQRAEYSVYGITVAPGGVDEPGVTARTDLRYPADWSKKKDGVDLRPHLSTIDALVLGVQLSELHLTHAYGLGDTDRAAMRLRKVVLRAGTEPQEDLTDIPLAAVPARFEEDPEAVGGHVSTYDCVVGGLRVRCEIEHPVVRRATVTTGFQSLCQALGPRDPRFYGEGFKLRRHSINDVSVDVAALIAEADIRFTSVPGSPVPTQGIGGGDQPSVSLVDCFVVNLQLAQVLMYELDSLTRESSNTLWMMQTVLRFPRTAQPLPSEGAPALRARTSITGKRLLPLRGATWRSVDLQGQLGGIDMRCTFAHELPADNAAR